MQLEEFKKKKAAAQASKRATPLTTPQITPLPTPIKAPEPASRSSTPAAPANRPQQDSLQAEPVGGKRKPRAGNGNAEPRQHVPSEVQQQPKEEMAAPSHVEVAAVHKTSVALESLPKASGDEAARAAGSKKPALAAVHENGNVQSPDANKQGTAALEQEVAHLKAELASEQQRHASEVQQLNEALKKSDAALSSHTADAQRGAQELQALLQHREEEVKRLHAQLTDLNASVEQQAAAAAAEWQSTKARLEEQVCFAILQRLVWNFVLDSPLLAIVSMS